MKNIWLMTWFTVREALARKVFIFFLAISSLVMLGLILIFSMNSSSILIQSLNNSGQTVNMGDAAKALEVLIISPLSILGLLLAIFSCSSFIPNMLEKGNIDLLLSKPISRFQIMLGKYLGGVLVVLLNITFLILGVWLIVSFKFSYWDVSFLWSIIIITFTFAVLYALIVLFGVLTKSSILGMMIAYFIFLIFSPIMAFVRDRIELLTQSQTVKSILLGIYYIVPKTSELMGSTILNLSVGKGVADYQPIYSSFIFLIAILGITISLFMKKDF